jgi:hypothetical protein
VSFDLNSYTDVAERIRLFYDRFPDGRLVTVDWDHVEVGGKHFILCHAKAFRTQDDPLPGDGLAWEPVPGPTQFTRDSELMNAQTAAWGRAIVALGFETKKIASRQEVQARNGSGEPASGSGDRAATAPQKPATPRAGQQPTGAAVVPSPDKTGAYGFEQSRGDFVPPAAIQAELAAKAEQRENRENPDDGGDPLMVVIHFGKNAGKRLGDLTQKQQAWYATSWTPNPQFENAQDRRLKTAAEILCGVKPEPVAAGEFSDDEIPF